MSLAKFAPFRGMGATYDLQKNNFVDYGELFS